MGPNGQYGRTAPAVANILREQTFDFAEDQQQPRTLGKTEAPVNLLPELASELLPPQRVLAEPEWVVRHTTELGIAGAEVRLLWEHNLVAIHYEDLKSTSPQDYTTKKAKRAIGLLNKLATKGGYVWADYWTHDQDKVGYVQPNSQMGFKEVTHKDSVKNGKAILKVLSITKVKTIEKDQFLALRAGKPNRGAISRWNGGKGKLGMIVRGEKIPREWASLTTAQQETVCSEFLRSYCHHELPTLKRLLLPPGRTLKDIDIYGLGTDGKTIFGQVTFLSDRNAKKKAKMLQKYTGQTDATCILFCQCDCLEIEKRQDGLIYIPTSLVYNWLEKDAKYCDLLFDA